MTLKAGVLNHHMHGENFLTDHLHFQTADDHFGRLSKIISTHEMFDVS